MARSPTICRLVSLHYISFLFCYVSTLLLSSPSLYFSITSSSLSPYRLFNTFWLSSLQSLLVLLFSLLSFLLFISPLLFHLSSTHSSLFTSLTPLLLLISPLSFPFLLSLSSPQLTFSSPLSSLSSVSSPHLSCIGCRFQTAQLQQLDRTKLNKLINKIGSVAAGGSWTKNKANNGSSFRFLLFINVWRHQLVLVFKSLHNVIFVGGFMFSFICIITSDGHMAVLYESSW